MGKKVTPLQKLVMSNEGYSRFVYKCTADKSTVGYGTNLEARGISEEEALFILNNDLKGIRMNMGLHGLSGFMTDSQEAAIADMAYNLGWKGLMGFKKMILAIKCGEFELAAEELMDSKYAREDVPERAGRNANLLAGRSRLDEL